MTLKSYFPDGRFTLETPSRIIWECDIRPTANSCIYRIKIDYKQGKAPLVYVVKPKPLQLAEGCKMLPHVYSHEEQRLCLYYPREWNKSELLVKSIIPWASEWLQFYELWLITGKWLGDGAHPRKKK